MDEITQEEDLLEELWLAFAGSNRKFDGADEAYLQIIKIIEEYFSRRKNEKRSD